MKIKLANAVRNAADRVAQARATEGFLAPGESVALTSSPYASMDAINLRGFALPETDGIWSGAAVSSIEVRLRGVSVDRRYRVTVAALPFAVPEHRAQVSVAVNGGPPANVLVDGHGWAAIAIECSIDASRKVPMIRLEFTVANPTSPASLGMGNDSRNLGFKVRALQIDDIGPQSEAPLLITSELLEPRGLGGVIGGRVSRLVREPRTVLRGWVRGPLWTLLRMDHNPAVRLVRWMRRVTRLLLAAEQRQLQAQVQAEQIEAQLSLRLEALEDRARGQEEALHGLRNQHVAGLLPAPVAAPASDGRELRELLAALDERVHQQQALLQELLASAKAGTGTAGPAPDAATAAPMPASAELAALGERIDQQQHQLVDVVEQGRQLLSICRRYALGLGQDWIITTGFGTFSCSREDILLATCLLDSGDVERGLRLFLTRQLGAGDVFVDVGANIGLHTVVAAKQVGNTGRVYAIEAMPRTLEHLRASLVLNGGLPQVTVLPVAAGARTQQQTFHIGRIAGHSSLYPLQDEVAAIDVEVQPLDALIDAAAVRLVKIDVEGAELDVLAGMTRLLASQPGMAIIAEYAGVHLGRAGSAQAQWDAFRTAHRMELYLLDDLDGHCVPLADFGDLAARATSNVLMCPPGWLAGAEVQP